jgi:hypothetical protein
MIESFTLKNLTINKELKFGQDNNFEYLFKDGGIDFDTASATHNTHTYPTQLGVSISSSKISERNITITGYVFYIPTNDDKAECTTRKELKQYVYEKILEKKKILNEFINPLNDIRMIIGEYYIDGRPTQSIKYSTNESENNIYFCQFLINLYCANPMFKKNTVTKTSIGGSYPLFMFPLVNPPQGVVMSGRQNYRTIVVQNEGDAEVGAKITLKAKGEVKNPRIYNIVTNEYMQIWKTMEKGEEIVITTLDGSEKGVKGYLNSIEYNYFKYWDFSNIWLKFNIGETRINYDTSDGNDENLNIIIELNPIKYGLEAM